MAHHDSTPQTVIDAPRPTVVFTATPLGANRRERRHGMTLPPKLGKDAGGRYLYGVWNAERNAPAVRVSPRRGRKARRQGGAR